MTDAQLHQERIDRTGLHAGATAFIAQFRSVNRVLPIRAEKRQRTKPIDKILACAQPGKSLSQFLRDQPGGDDEIAAFNRLTQRKHLG